MVEEREGNRDFEADAPGTGHDHVALGHAKASAGLDVRLSPAFTHLTHLLWVVFLWL